MVLKRKYNNYGFAEFKEMLPLVSGWPSDAAVGTFSSRPHYTPKKPKLKEAALDSASYGLTSTPLVLPPSLVKTLIPTICLCTGWQWKRYGNVKKGVREMEGSQGKEVVQTRESSWVRENPTNSTPSPQQHILLSHAPQFCLRASSLKSRVTHQCFATRREDMISSISK